MKRLSFLLGFCYVLAIVLGLAAGCFFGLIHYQAIDFSVLEHPAIGEPSVLLDDQGEVWDSFQQEKHKDILLSELPLHLIHAFVAAEDHAFFSHSGISWPGIIRSLLVNCYYGKIIQGASTITQQLVKLLFTDSQRTFKRKIKEQIVALLVERYYSKEQILQTYLNNIYFGAGLYGVEAASQRFWSKSASQICVDEAAILAAIVKNPAHYCPIWYPLSAKKRRNVILSSMKRLGFIDHKVFDEASAKQVSIECVPCKQGTAHFKEAVRLMIEPLVGKEKLYKGGLRIATTLNQPLQDKATRAFSKRVAELRAQGLFDIDGGAILQESRTGHIKAMIGGFDFNQSQFNRALQAKRQIGSIIKPFIYAAAVEQGISLTTLAQDAPLDLALNVGHWKPRNAHRAFEGTITLARALGSSNNIVSIKTLCAVGIESFVELLHKTRVAVNLKPYPSLALGCVDATVKDVTGMFNILANNGRWIEPTYIRWVAEPEGKKIVTVHPETKQVLSGLTTGQIISVLRGSIARACARSGLHDKFRAAFGKTGTTNDSRTVWFAGATPSLTTVIYLGTDDNKSLGKNVFGNRTAFPIWFDIYKEYEDNSSFFYDSRLKECSIQGKTGMLCSYNAPHAISVLIPEEEYRQLYAQASHGEITQLKWLPEPSSLRS